MWSSLIGCVLFAFLIFAEAACAPTPRGPTPGVTVSTEAPLITSEDGTIAMFNVTLSAPPSSSVTVTFESRDTTEGYIGSDTDTDSGADRFGRAVDLVFTPSNWKVPQIIQVMGLPDSQIDGNQTYSVAVTWLSSLDLSYANVAKPSVSVTNVDTSKPSITVSTRSVTTSESGGSQTIGVKLNVQPQGEVQIPLTIGDASEGSFSSYNSQTTTTLTFNTWNWSSTQYAYVYGVNDTVSDGNQTYQITVGPAVSSDPGYNGLVGDAIAVTNTDNDAAAFTVSADTLQTKEWGGNATFTVVLNTQPTGNVVIPVKSADTSEGLLSGGSVTTPTESLDLTFTPTNWQVPQTVTVNAQDDLDKDGDISYDVTVGPPTGADAYAALLAKTVKVLNIDDDVAKVNIAGANLQTTEAGGTGTFVVSLAKAPSGTVVLNVTSGDPTEGRLKGGSSPTAPIDAITLTFTTADWRTAQTVTVVGQDDFEIDGNQNYLVNVAVDTVQTQDAEYRALSTQSVSVTNADNDTAGFTLEGYSVYAWEGGANGSFTVKLNTVPTADVTIPVTVPNTDQLLISSGGGLFSGTVNLTFTPANWSTPQTVTVQAVDDLVDEGYSSSAFGITVGPTMSSDSNYNGLAAKTKTAYLYDNDSAGFVLTPNGVTTTEGGSASFTVALKTQPTANVFVTVSSSNVAEGLLTDGDQTTPVDVVTLEFTPATWQSGQTVTVHGVDDSVLDGPATLDLTVAALDGSDIGYNDASNVKVTVTNNDNEAGISETKSLPRTSLPYTGQVAKASTSTYTITGLAPGWKYTMAADNVTDDIALTVKDGATVLCSSTKAGAKVAESCRFTTPATGSVSVVIDGAGTYNGAAFTLSLVDPKLPVTFQVYCKVYSYLYLYDSDIITNPGDYSLDYDWCYPGTKGGSASITYEVPAGATYYLKVYPYSASYSGAYKVQATNLAASLTDAGNATASSPDVSTSPADAYDLALDTPVASYLTDYSDVDWFKVTAVLPY